MSITLQERLDREYEGLAAVIESNKENDQSGTGHMPTMTKPEFTLGMLHVVQAALDWRDHRVREGVQSCTAHDKYILDSIHELEAQA